MRSSTETLIAACRQLAVDVQSLVEDDIATLALLEIADRLEELNNDLETLAMHSEGRCVCRDLRDLVHGRPEVKE
jgi:hypothetical protein